MMIAKYLGLKKGGTPALILSNRSLNQAAGFTKLGNVSVCLHGEIRISIPGASQIAWTTYLVSLPLM